MSARTALAGALAGLLLLAGCSSDDDSEGSAPASGSPSATPAPPSPSTPSSSADVSEAPVAPEDGACYELSYDAALAPTSDAAAGDCDTDHTSRTFSVGELDLVAEGHLLAVDSERAQQQPAERCPAQLEEFLGGSRDELRLSVFRSVWFSPTVEQSDAGAGWFRCDVIALSRDGELAPLTGRLQGVLSRPDEAEQWRVCGTAEPGTDGFQRVACSQDHSWRALSVVDLGDDSADYPGEDAASSAGEGTCEDAARDSADDPLNFRWGYEWPSAEQWDAGQRYGLCWAPA